MNNINNWYYIYEKIQELLPEYDGFECYPFKIGRYNDAVSSHFKLDYDDDTLAILTLNTPKMFEGAFKKWLVSKKFLGETVKDVSERITNPIQDFMVETLNTVVSKFPEDIEIEVIHDYDMTAMRKPKILMCTCGHVAGAAFYCRPEIISTNTQEIESLFPVKPEKPIIGFSIHPKYGGHFAFRAVFILKNVKLPQNFVEKEIKNPLKNIEDIKELLILFNLYWRDGKFRDCGKPVERYSDLQLEYFSKPPIERWNIIKHWFDEETILIEDKLIK